VTPANDGSDSGGAGERPGGKTRSPSGYYPAIGLAFVLYLALAVPYPNSPGVYYDEAWQAPVGVFLSQPSVRASHASAWAITLGGHVFPLMSGDYIGALKGYLLGAAFYLFGCSVPAMRLTTVAVGLVGLLFTAGFARRAFGPVAAVVTTVLIATDPSLIMLGRHDWGPQIMAFALRMSSLYCAARWWRDHRRGYLLCSAVLLGVGVWDKASFLWFVIASVVAGVWVWLTSDERPQVTVKDAASAIGAFLLGGAPFWIFNLTHDWVTFRLISVPGAPASLGNLIERAPARTRYLLSLLRGRAVDEWMFGRVLAPVWGISTTVLIPLSILAFVVIVIACVRRRSATLLAVPVLLVSFAAQIYATPRPVWVHHWIGLYPLPHLMIGLMGSLVLAWWSGRRMRRYVFRGVVAGLVVLGVISNVAVMRGYQRLMAAKRSSVAWSDAIYPLAKNLMTKYAGRTIEIMDWGAFNQLDLLSSGRLRLAEPFWSEANDAAPSATYLNMLAEPNNIYVFIRKQKEGKCTASRQHFDLALEKTGMVVSSEEAIEDHYGRPVFWVVSLSRAKAL